MSYDTSAIRDKSAFNRAIRQYFDSRNYLEVDSPMLSPSPIPESHIELFRTARLLADGGSEILHLLPSPELWLKLLLAEGAPSLYQIGRCFRNGEQLDRWHRLEFTMLEWYSLNKTAEENIQVLEDLLDTCCDAVGNHKDTRISGTIQRMTMEEAFCELAGFSLESDLLNVGLDQVKPGEDRYDTVLSGARNVLAHRLKERGMPFDEKESADDLFHRLFLTSVEDNLPSGRPLALTHWPQLVPTLAKRIPGTPWAERWELYIHGVEVANCYGEESDKETLTNYWDTETAIKRRESGGFQVPEGYGNDWIKRVSRGMPDCSGVAVGLDRLLALIRGDDSLEGLDLFPIHDIIRR